MYPVPENNNLDPQKMKAPYLFLLLLIIAACSDMPNEPAPDASRYELTVVAEYETIWSGDSIRFIVTPEWPPSQGSVYRWEYDFCGHREIVNTGEPAVTVLIPECEDVFAIEVTVMTNGRADDAYYPGGFRAFVNKTTGVLSIVPDTAYWDVGIPLALSASYEGRIANEAMVHWAFGDGAELAAAPSDIVQHAFTTPGVYAATAILKLPGSDSVIASTTGHIEIGSLTPGRFLTFTIIGLERTYRREYTSSSGQTSYSDVTRSDTITGSSAEFLRWEGDAFTLMSDQVLGSDFLRSCGGLLEGSRIDTVRIQSIVGGILDGHSISMKLSDIPRVSDHQWMQTGMNCAASLTEYADIGSVWGGVRMPGDTSPRPSTRYVLKSWRFLDNARILITINHDRRD